MSGTPTLACVGDALRQARASGVERLDAQCLAAHRLRRSRAWVIAHDDAPLSPVQAQELAALIERRAAGEPLAYLVGEREFHGLMLDVTPAVLVPRPDTEVLVDWALELLAGPLAERAQPRVADLGTGSGAIALAVRHACPRARVHGSDISAAALDVARRNGARLALDVAWHAGAWWQALPPPAFDLVLSNPPYVAPGDPHLPALRHEPAGALVPRADDGLGLADLQRIVAGGAAGVTAGGWLLLEHGADQGAAVRSLLTDAGFVSVETRFDLADRPRASGGARPG